VILMGKTQKTVTDFPQIKKPHLSGTTKFEEMNFSCLAECFSLKKVTRQGKKKKSKTLYSL